MRTAEARDSARLGETATDAVSNSLSQSVHPSRHSGKPQSSRRSRLKNPLSPCLRGCGALSLAIGGASTSFRARSANSCGNIPRPIRSRRPTVSASMSANKRCSEPTYVWRRVQAANTARSMKAFPSAESMGATPTVEGSGISSRGSLYSATSACTASVVTPSSASSFLALLSPVPNNPSSISALPTVGIPRNRASSFARVSASLARRVKRERSERSGPERNTLDSMLSIAGRGCGAGCAWSSASAEDTLSSISILFLLIAVQAPNLQHSRSILHLCHILLEQCWRSGWRAR